MGQDEHALRALCVVYETRKVDWLARLVDYTKLTFLKDFHGNVDKHLWRLCILCMRPI